MTKQQITRADVLSVANAVSLVGLCFTLYGAFHIGTLAGVLILGTGRFIDVFDGKIARATHVSSFGALVDATCDKIGITALIIAVWSAGIAPYWLLVYMAAQNIMNILISGVSAARGGKPTSSRNGKYAMFVQNISIGCYALGSVTDFQQLEAIGLGLGVISLYWGIRATYGYAKLIPAKQRREPTNTGQ